MSRRTLLLVVAVAAVLAATAAILVVPGIARAPGASPPAASATADDGGEGAIDGRVAWAFVSMLPPDRAPGAYALQAGFLGEDAPRVDLEVPWAVDPSVDVGRAPAVGRPVDGAVVYVADDGRRSTIHRVALEDGAPEPDPLVGLAEAVWDIAVAPDGSSAYLALTGRDGGQEDRGVVRVALDGSQGTERILPPARGKAQGAEPADIRLAAVLAFNVNLEVSDDGRFLLRTSCLGIAGCTSEIVDLGSGEIVPLGPDPVIDVGPGGTIIWERCGNVGCQAEVVDVVTGDRIALRSIGFDSSLAVSGDRRLVVAIEAVDGAPAVVATDLADGARRELYRSADALSITLSRNEGLLWDSPPGTTLVTVTVDRPGPDAGAVIEVDQHYLLLPLGGGAPVELAPPAIRQLFPPGAQG